MEKDQKNDDISEHVDELYDKFPRMVQELSTEIVMIPIAAFIMMKEFKKTDTEKYYKVKFLFEDFCKLCSGLQKRVDELFKEKDPENQK